MQIILNGRTKDVAVDCTGAVLLDELALATERVAVERNGEALNRQTFSECILSSGDVIEIVRFVGGG